MAPPLSGGPAPEAGSGIRGARGGLGVCIQRRPRARLCRVCSRLRGHRSPVSNPLRSCCPSPAAAEVGGHSLWGKPGQAGRGAARRAELRGCSQAVTGAGGEMLVHPAPRTAFGPLRSFRGKRFREGGGELAQGPGGLVSIPWAFSCRADLTLIGEANSREAPFHPRTAGPASSIRGRTSGFYLGSEQPLLSVRDIYEAVRGGGMLRFSALLLRKLRLRELDLPCPRSQPSRVWNPSSPITAWILPASVHLFCSRRGARPPIKCPCRIMLFGGSPGKCRMKSSVLEITLKCHGTVLCVDN